MHTPFFEYVGVIVAVLYVLGALGFTLLAILSCYNELKEEPLICTVLLVLWPFTACLALWIVIVEDLEETDQRVVRLENENAQLRQALNLQKDLF